MEKVTEKQVKTGNNYISDNGNGEVLWYPLNETL